MPEQHRDSDPDDKDRYPARTNEEGHRRRHHASLIESMNARLRKVTRNRGQFPSEQAALKVLYLAVRNLEEFRTPNLGSAVPGGKSAAGIHDLLRRPNLNPDQPRSLTETIGRSAGRGRPGIRARRPRHGAFRRSRDAPTLQERASDGMEVVRNT